MISSALGAFAQSMFAIIPPSDPHENSYLGIMPLILIGVSHCIFMTSVWPMIWIVVKPKVIGSAYGICTVFNNIGLGIAPIMVGLLTFKNEEVNMYFWANIFLCSFWVIGLLLWLILFISDKHSHNGILQKPSKNIEKYDDFEEAKDISTHPYPDI